LRKAKKKFDFYLYSLNLLPNHFHLLIEVKQVSIPTFMHFINTWYSGYFNRRYKRHGHFFQDRFTAVHIKTDEQLRAVFVYIHTNPVSLIEPKWKERGIARPEKVIEFLENYKWSSYQDYLGKKNFSSVTDRNFLLETVGGRKKVREIVNDWIKHKKTIKGENEIFLE